jgi:hypothetical protein
MNQEYAARTVWSMQINEIKNPSPDSFSPAGYKANAQDFGSQ